MKIAGHEAEPRPEGCNESAQRAPLPRCLVVPDYTLRLALSLPISLYYQF